LNHSGDTVEQEETEIWADFYRNFISQSENANEPVSDFTHPIINETNRVTVAGAHDYDPDQSTIVGVIVAEFYWRSMFR
jgi:hypothetical protein